MVRAAFKIRARPPVWLGSENPPISGINLLVQSEAGDRLQGFWHIQLFGDLIVGPFSPPPQCFRATMRINPDFRDT
jgi:hypothetical protein